MEPDRPPGLPPDLWERVLQYQKVEEEFRERKQRFLSSLETGNDKVMDRALDQLRAEEKALKKQRSDLSAELRERFGMEL